ncbi:DUF5655 domain-containing protein [Cryobacterium tagatosivorans]|uniref:DNA replication protein DnaC n=1 Tax=Cryobacterium tagatosivorans TaxID=1259199 RepID=A0A4R8UE78_9MICO|nr:DUF5655 domain-containing protein [Cryobacterium tagatosivorans]TFB49901.1 DNA replication protein DnaC [Cryobacterium tagatosivorans]
MAATAIERIQADDAAREIFEILQGALAQLGGHEIEEKQGSLHVTNGRAFLGIHPRSGAVLLNLVTSEPIVSERIRKSEQVSRNRWLNEIVIRTTAEVDAELAGWLRTAYALTE